MAGVYIHIPFCKRICAYCDFYKSAQVRYLDEVVEQMHRELEERSSFLQDRQIETLYFGGGTPSLAPIAQLKGLVQRVGAIFDRNHGGEVTLEANPDDLTPEYLAGLREAGFNRLSIGIQSFDDRVLRWMNRRHTAAQAIEAVKEARRAGFENLSVDLIYGVPETDEGHLERNLEALLALDVEHISAYHLTIEPATALGRRMARGELQPVEESVSEREYARVDRFLTEAGYDHYEISNFAREGFRARHNAAYWQGREYLGIGPGAHSFNGRERCWSAATVEQYRQGEWLLEGERLTPEDRFNEYLMTGLRCREGISLEVIAERFGAPLAEQTRRLATVWLREGGLLQEGAHLRIPTDHFLISDAVIESLLEV